MKRRQSECFRNLDDPLKIFSLLTVKSCGLVLLFYAGAVLSELLFGLFSLLVGDWSFLAQIGASALLGVILAFAERHDDEHLVPSAIRYCVSRRWRVLYSGGRAHAYAGHPLEELVQGGPWHR
jgi:hypothetical protein